MSLPWSMTLEDIPINSHPIPMDIPSFFSASTVVISPFYYIPIDYILIISLLEDSIPVLSLLEDSISVVLSPLIIYDDIPIGLLVSPFFPHFRKEVMSRTSDGINVTALRVLRLARLLRILRTLAADCRGWSLGRGWEFIGNAVMNGGWRCIDNII